jgi:predicted dehydrogenase
MAKYRAGVFGLGNVATEYVRAVSNNPLSEVAAVVGRDREKTEARVRSLGLSSRVMDEFPEMLRREDIDFVVITTPHNLHFKPIIAAAEAGKHVVVEKPIGMNWEEIVKVKEAIGKAGVKFQCGLVLRFNPFIENLRRLIEMGALGEIFHLEVDYFHSLRDAWGGFQWGVHKRSGGPSASLVAGIHAVDLLRYLCGEVTEVAAYSTTAHRKDFEYDPSYLAALRFENGAIGKSSCSFETRSPYLLNLLMHGTKGSVFNDRFFMKDLFPGQTTWQRFETVMPDSPAVSHHPFQQLIDDFIAAVDTNRQSRNNIEEMYKSHELCVAIDRSMESGEKVKLPLN